VHEQRGSSTLTWTPRDTLSAYIDGGYERLFNLQNGYTGLDTAPWLASDTERFWNMDIGGRWVPQERWTLTVDYLLAPSYDDTNHYGGRSFPGFSAELDQTRFDALRSCV
jgi:hypothetical protein